MKLVIERGELLRALGHVTSVVERRTTIPILSNVLLSASGSALSLKATDLEREVIEDAKADVATNGSLTVPAHILHDIARKLPDGSQVRIERDGEQDRLTVVAGQAKFALQTLPAEDFPDLALGDVAQEFTISAGDLKRLIDKTRFAISTEETRYYLNGIYMHAAESDGKKMLRAVATDGHRLAQVELPIPAGAEDMPGIIVPRKTVHELHRLIETSGADLTIGVSPTKVRFEIGTVTLTSKLIDGTFPDYASVIPKDNDKEMMVSKAEFVSAVDRVSTMASERGRAVKLNIGQDKLELSVNNPDGGSASEQIGAGYTADDLEIGFNAKYLLDIAAQLEGDEARFLLADPRSSTMVRDSEDASSLYVLMPLRV